MLEVVLSVRPASSRQDIKILKDGTVKAFLKSVPEKGKANRELIKFVARILDIRRCCVKIKSGRKSQKKKLCIENVSAGEFMRAVEKFQK